MDWVTPKELEAALIDKCGSRLSILNAICGRVETDLLRVEADRLIVDGVASSDSSYLKRLFGLRERLEGSWNMADIGGVLNRNRYQFMKVQAFGVRFSKADAEAMGAVFKKEDAGADASARQLETRHSDLEPTPPNDRPGDEPPLLIPARSRLSPQQVEDSYVARVSLADSAGVNFTREQDEMFLKSIGVSGKVRDRVRELRGQHAPHWREGGRPPKPGE